jgi:hypothetical protein
MKSAMMYFYEGKFTQISAIFREFQKKSGKIDKKSVFFPYKNQRPTVRKITDIVTADTKSGCQFRMLNFILHWGALLIIKLF